VIQLDVIDIDSGSRGSPFNVKFYSGIFAPFTSLQTLKPRHTKFSQVWNVYTTEEPLWIVSA
jgi:hypothetical protein